MRLPFYDLDVLAVGDGERSGDAMAIRYSMNGGNWRVMVIDGGNQDAGDRLVELIRREYETDFVNDVLNTHPDSDHSSGLSRVLEQLKVGTLWMHKPWQHLPHILDAFDDNRITPNSAVKRAVEALRCAASVHDLAVKKGVPIYEPFAGANIGGFVALSPSRDRYLSLLPHFRSTPETSLPSPLMTGIGAPRRIAGSGGLAALGFAAAQAEFVAATPANEHAALGRKPTAAENESSVILLGVFGVESVLFTADAGAAGLSEAVLLAARHGISLKNLRLLQLPHHGSRNNLNPALLDLITARTAFVSASAKSPTHPRRAVTNAFQRRGTSVFATQGSSLHFRLNTPMRNGWSDVDAVPWHTTVEAA